MNGTNEWQGVTDRNNNFSFFKEISYLFRKFIWLL